MRVLQILPALTSGGVETGTVDFARELKKRGIHNCVISSGGPLVKELIKMKVPHYSIPVHVKGPAALLTLSQIRKVIREERIDIVHARSRVPAWLAWLANIGTGATFITTCHGYYSEHFFSRIMGWGRRVIVISRAIERHMNRGFGIPHDRMDLIWRGVHLEKYPYIADHYTGHKKDKFVVANIGRLTPIKGHEHFLKAIRLVSLKVPNLEAWIIGGIEPGKESYANELKTMAVKLGIDKKIKWMGRCDNIPDLLPQIDLVALTTNVPEAFGRVLIEAGARGTAVVSTRTGGVVEVIQDQVDGLLVEVDDERTLASCIEETFKYPEKTQARVATFRKKIETHFTLEGMTDKILQVYEKALNQVHIIIPKFGSLGDLALIVPSLRALKKKHAGSRIFLVTDPIWMDFMRNCPYVDELIPLKRRGLLSWVSLFLVALRLRRIGMDLSVDFQNNRRSYLLSFLSGSSLRYGFRRGMFGFLLNRGMPFKKALISPVHHQFELLKALGIFQANEHLELWVHENEKIEASRLTRSIWFEPGELRIGFSLSASPKWRTKNWPERHYLDLAKGLDKRLPLKIFLLGTSDASPLAESFRRERLPFVIDLVGQTRLSDIRAIIVGLDLLVTGDSAMMHLAAAAGIPFVALFGPTNPQRHMPPAQYAEALYADVECAPCYKAKCNAPEFICMPRIRPEQVEAKVMELLRASKKFKEANAMEKKVEDSNIL